MMTSLLAVMITFGTQDTGKAGVRDCQGWQPLSVSRCHGERGRNARTSDASPPATLCLTAASAAQEPGRSREGEKTMAGVVFEVSCHVVTEDGGELGDKTHACQHSICWKPMHVEPENRLASHCVEVTAGLR